MEDYNIPYCNISIICPVYNEEKYILQCIETIISSDYPVQFMEVIFIDGNSSDKTREIIQKYKNKYDYIRILDNPNTTVPFALNKAIKESNGDLIIRIDAHSLYPKNYFSKLVYWSKKLNADNVGGICQTDVIYKTSTAMSIAQVMKDKFGVGNSLFRTGSTAIKEVDTVPFGCFKRDIFNKIGLFDERLTRNQDIEFNKRLKRNNGKIYLVPEITCTYIPRDNFKDFAKNRYLTGLWIINTSFYTGTLKNLGIRHFIPFLFVSSLICSILLSLIWPLFIIYFILTFGLYSFILFSRSIIIKTNETSILKIFFSFIILHFSYGCGSLVGLYNNIILLNKKK